MIINITPHCTLMCPHCMQCSGPYRQDFMSGNTFCESLNFAQAIGSNAILISGGEPTSHPMFLSFLEEALDRNKLITVLSNGTFLRDHEFTERFAEIVKDNQYFSMQISSFKGLYDNYNEIHKPNLKGLRLFGSSVVVCDETNTEMKMKPLGRACNGKYFEEAKRVNGFPSCINSCLILAQSEKTRLIGALLESFGKFCNPMVSWDGNIRLGESEQCRVVANISEPFDDIVDKIFEFRPCGGCASYDWHLKSPSTSQEKKVMDVLFKNKIR